MNDKDDWRFIDTDKDIEALLNFVQAVGDRLGVASLPREGYTTRILASLSLLTAAADSFAVSPLAAIAQVHGIEPAKMADLLDKEADLEATQDITKGVMRSAARIIRAALPSHMAPSAVDAVRAAKQFFSDNNACSVGMDKVLEAIARNAYIGGWNDNGEHFRDAPPSAIAAPVNEALNHIAIWKSDGRLPRVYVSLTLDGVGFWSYSDDDPDGIAFAMRFKEKYGIKGAGEATIVASDGSAETR